MKRTKKQTESLLAEALKRFESGVEAWREVYEAAIDDIRFVDVEGAQWDEQSLNVREGRPCLTVDKVSGALDQVIGDYLQNRPGLKIVAAEEGDEDTAEIYEGLVRQIESRGNRAYKTAFKFTAKGGFGVWHLRHDYIAENSMDQDILLDEVKNPFSVILDPIIQHSPLDKMRWGFIFADIDKDEFDAMYPNAKVNSAKFESYVGGKYSEWHNEREVRVAIYYRLVPSEKTICQLSTGEIVDKQEIEPILDELLMAGVEITRERTVDCHILECYKLTAAEILEEYECIGSRVPLVPVFGKNSVVDGKFYTRGLVRKAKDPQKLYNYERSQHVEVVALQPKQPLVATPEMIRGHERMYQQLNVANLPVLLFNPDPNMPGASPRREPPAMPSSGLLADMQIASDDIKATTGQYDASLGARSNETSGKAINARQREGDIATYEFTDELVAAMEYTGRIFIDWIPKVYDATRQVRILGEDDAEEVVEVNKPVLDQQSGQEIIINDLSRGRYDLRVAIGPSYATRRQETAEQLTQITSQNQQLGMLLGDLIVKNLDIVGGDEAVKRLRMLGIKQGFVEPTEEEQQEMQAKEQQNQQQNALKQLAMQLKMADMKTTLEEKQAGIQKTKADTAKTIQEVQKVQSETNLNQAKVATMKYDAITKTVMPVAR